MEIRKCRRWTQWDSSEVVNLDPEKFRTLNKFPYKGETEEDFIKYIQFLFQEYAIYDGKLDDLDRDTYRDLLKLDEEVEWEEYRNSLNDEEKSWYEIGKSGTDGFDALFSTED